MNRRLFLQGLGLCGLGMYSSEVLSNNIFRLFGVQLYTVRNAVYNDLEGSL
jgi:hypothetical protein